MSHDWQDKYKILDKDHEHDLATRSAIHEFKNKMPREEADKQAHKDYVKQKAIEAAAHHYMGMRAAAALDDRHLSKKHAKAYEAACKAMGESDVGAPSQEILDHIKNHHPSVYKFAKHPHDDLWEKSEPAQKDPNVQEILDTLTKLKDKLK